MSVYNTIGKSKKQVCLENKPVAYWSGYNGLEIHYIDNMFDFVYYKTNAWYPSRNGIKYHRAKIYYWDKPYFKHNSQKVYFDDCIRM